MEAHKITVPRTAHYYTIGTPSKAIRQLWIVAHGYGQLAKKFIYKFEEFDDGKTLVLAPDALSRFYFKGFSGSPGSSWMTREDRLDEIADYVGYLQTIYDLFVPQLSDSVQINFLGFSQGCATICRWMMAKFPRFDHLVLWAGLLPEDLDYRPHLDYVQAKKPLFVYGVNDEFITPERIEWYENLIKTQGIRLDVRTFEGKHEVTRDLLLEIKKEFDARLPVVSP